MQERLIGGAGLKDAFDALISTDAARTFKPDPRAYALGPKVLGLAKEEIAFSAFGGWDAAGAKWFGFRTFWVNRLGVAAEELSPGPDATGPALAELAAFVERAGRYGSRRAGGLENAEASNEPDQRSRLGTALGGVSVRARRGRRAAARRSAAPSDGLHVLRALFSGRAPH